MTRKYIDVLKKNPEGVEDSDGSFICSSYRFRYHDSEVVAFSRIESNGKGGVTHVVPGYVAEEPFTNQRGNLEYPNTEKITDANERGEIERIVLDLALEKGHRGGKVEFW